MQGFAVSPYKPSPWGEGAPVRTLGRMRGPVLDWGRCTQGGFRRLRAATYFAHGGSSSQSPLHSVSAWRRKLRSFPCSSSSRQTRCAGLRREQRGIGQNAAGDAADGLRLRCAPPRSIGPPPLRGLPLGRCAALPARNTRSAWVPFRPAPLGA